MNASTSRCASWNLHLHPGNTMAQFIPLHDWSTAVYTLAWLVDCSLYPCMIGRLQIIPLHDWSVPAYTFAWLVDCSLYPCMIDWLQFIPLHDWSAAVYTFAWLVDCSLYPCMIDPLAEDSTINLLCITVFHSFARGWPPQKTHCHRNNVTLTLPVVIHLFAQW